MRIVNRLDPQLHVTSEANSLSKIDHAQVKGVIDFKPLKALWTSTYKPETGSEWVEWCCYNMPKGLRDEKGNPANFYLLTQDRDCRICELTTIEEALAFTRIYGTNLIEGYEGVKNIRWDKVALDFDAIHCTIDHWQVLRYLDSLELIWLGYWDVESTCWFKWVFTEPELIEPSPEWLVTKEE